MAVSGDKNGKYRHGMTNTPTYKTWHMMNQRCDNQNDPSFFRYGSRGISVCPEWRDFKNFLRDMGVRPANTTIDRINNDGNYEPSNCRWASPKENNRNKSNNRLFEFKGETYCVAEWAERIGISMFTLFCRLNRGWSIERTLTEAINTKYCNKKYTLEAAA